MTENMLVNSILEDIKKSKSSRTSNAKPTETTTEKAKKTIETLRGKPKSGRFWKTRKERFSTVNKTRGLKQNLEKKTTLRIELKRIKDMSKQILEKKKQEAEQRKERRRENLKRAEENRKKSEVVQVITNTAKLKKMRKKQLRFIEKRDTNEVIISK